MTEPINTHGMVCNFGRHKGTPYTRLPVSYLRWMVNERHSRANVAQAELDRRGTILPDLDISGHAVDRASLNCLRIWRETHRENEGIHAWLCRIAQEALDMAAPDDEGACFHLGMKLAFTTEGEWPVLKTVMPAKAKNGAPEEHQPKEPANAKSGG